MTETNTQVPEDGKKKNQKSYCNVYLRVVSVGHLLADCLCRVLQYILLLKSYSYCNSSGTAAVDR